MSKFEHISADKLVSYLKGRSYKYAQVHHTWKPNHADFTGSNHISLQQGMYNYHVNTNGWSDIGQHVTLFPDGTFVTGRPFSKTPAGIKGYNTGSFMVEIIGDFDKGKDKLEGDQLKSALKVYQYLVNHNGASILFHNEHAPKSCPGTGIDKAKFVKAVKNFDGKTVDVSSSNVSKPPKKPTSKPNSSGGSVVDYLVSKGIDSSFANRKKLAAKHNIANYKGTAAQNNALLSKLKGGSSGSSGKSSSSSSSSYRNISGNWTGQTLVKGVKGKPVRQLQTMLAKNNPPFYPNKSAKNNGIDEYFGDDTEDSVRRFQSYYGLSVDGKAGKEVYAKLGGKSSNKDSTSSSLPTGILKRGDRGKDVKQLQRALNKANFKVGKVDGIFGDKVADGVRRLQLVHDPHNVDSIYGPRARARLQKLI